MAEQQPAARWCWPDVGGLQGVCPGARDVGSVAPGLSGPARNAPDAPPILLAKWGVESCEPTARSCPLQADHPCPSRGSNRLFCAPVPSGCRFPGSQLPRSGSRRRTPLRAIMSTFYAGQKAFAPGAALSYTLVPVCIPRGRFPHSERSCGKLPVYRVGALRSPVFEGRHQQVAVPGPAVRDLSVALVGRPFSTHSGLTSYLPTTVGVHRLALRPAVVSCDLRSETTASSARSKRLLRHNPVPRMLSE
jgi:hypothetical protein